MIESLLVFIGGMLIGILFSLQSILHEIKESKTVLATIEKAIKEPWE